MADTTTSTGQVAAYLAEVEARSKAPVEHVTSLPITHPGVRALMESAANIPPLVAALRAAIGDHGDCAVYLGAEECDHPEPPRPETPHADPVAWGDWDADHPHGLGDAGRICLLTEIGRYCPACTKLVYDDDPIGDSYVDASNCIVLPPIAAALLGEEADG